MFRGQAMGPPGHDQNSGVCFTCARRPQVRSEQRTSLVCSLHASVDGQCLDLLGRGDGQLG